MNPYGETIQEHFRHPRNYGTLDSPEIRHEDVNPFCGDRMTINAPRDNVWGFLTDPTQLTDCAPGLESLKVITPNEKFRAVASIGFGAVKATFVTDRPAMARPAGAGSRADEDSRQGAGKRRRRNERDEAERRRERIDSARLVIRHHDLGNDCEPGGAPHGTRDARS